MALHSAFRPAAGPEPPSAVRMLAKWLVLVLLQPVEANKLEVRHSFHTFCFTSFFSTMSTWSGM